MGTVYDAIEGVRREETLKEKLWSQIILRLTWVTNGCTSASYLLKQVPERIEIPPARPSGSIVTHSYQCIGLDSNFLPPVPALSSFKMARGSHAHKLVGLSIDLFEEANKAGSNVLKFAQTIEAKLKKEFEAKDVGHPGLARNLEEYADYPRLSIFISERLLGFQVNGLSDPVAGPSQSEGPAFAVIYHDGNTVWSGPAAKAESRLAFVDALLLDKAQGVKLGARLQKIGAAAKGLDLGKQGLQAAYHKLEEDEGRDFEIDPGKLCYTPLCHSVYFGGKAWAFHNGAQVVRVVVDAYLKGMTDIHIDDIRAGIPANLEGVPLSQIFKTNKKDAAWKELIVDGPSGKGFYRLNPAYVENGVKEIAVGLRSSAPGKR